MSAEQQSNTLVCAMLEKDDTSICVIWLKCSKVFNVKRSVFDLT